MRVVFTGSKDEERFYANIAVAEALNDLVLKENFADVHFYYFSSEEGDKKMLYENNLAFRKIHYGGGGIQFLGFVESFLQLLSIFPDVIFSSGGEATKPVLLAAKVLGIPVIIHEPDSVPHDTNEWAQDQAVAITVAYKQAAPHFKKGNQEKIVHAGQPIRKTLRNPVSEGAYELLNLEQGVPIIWVRAGKSGGGEMNRVVEEALPELLEDYQIIHQAGKDSYEEMKILTQASLHNHDRAYRYHLYEELDDLSTKMLAAVSNLAITRAGVQLFELALWEIPAIVIPKTDTYRDIEIKNAYNYARAGAGIVIEENNLTDKGLIFEVRRILENIAVIESMKQGAREFRVDNAEEKIAKEIAKIYLEHEVEDSN